jgi:hypothetical protein
MIFWKTGDQTAIMPQIEFGKETLGLIVRNRQGLQVPINQRSYAWKRGHVRDLFTDLNGAIQDGAEEYFLGSIIVVVPDKANYIEVYDGQQRIATTMILIGAIRDFILSVLHDEKEAEVITEKYLIGAERRNQEVPKFTLSNADRDYFIDRILKRPDKRKGIEPDKGSLELIDEAAEEAAEHVKTITKNLQPDVQANILQKWMDYLEESARVIWVEVKDQATAYRIFETMNDRGLKLSAADLVKNYLYQLVSKNNADKITYHWHSMTAVLESLGREDGDAVDYLRYLWITSHGHTRSGDLFDKIKKEKSSENTALDFAVEIDQRSNDYAAILTPSHEAWSTFHQEVKSDIDTLRYLGVSQIRPLLLAAKMKFNDKEIARLFKNAVNWSVRCLIAGVPSGNIEGAYSKNAKAITDGKVTKVEQLVTEESMVNLIPRDDKFASAVKTASVPTASLARYYLRKIQIIADGKDEPEYTPNQDKDITLEHVLPQKPSADWKLPADKMQALYNRLGNLALLQGSVNSKLGNIGFNQKQPELAKSNFSLTNMIAKQADWNEKEISDRQQQLADYAVKAWPFLV